MWQELLEILVENYVESLESRKSCVENCVENCVESCVANSETRYETHYEAHYEARSVETLATLVRTAAILILSLYLPGSICSSAVKYVAQLDSYVVQLDSFCLCVAQEVLPLGC